MIINTGQRTDIPAFYSRWFMNRIREGYVMVRNPFYPSLVTRFSLDPKVVDVIGFCTKNPEPMLPYIDELKEYGVDVNGCMRMEDYEAAIGQSLKHRQKMNARKSFCACYLSNDIGAYNSCLHLCSYCYANGRKETILNNYKNHDDSSPFLIGNAMPYDTVKEAKQESWKEITLL